MSLNPGKRPSLKDKLDAQERALMQEKKAVEVELGAVTKAKGRASKKKK
jgi:hypothetical protein